MSGRCRVAEKPDIQPDKSAVPVDMVTWRYNLRNVSGGLPMQGVSTVLAFAGFLAMVFLTVTVLYQRHARTRAPLDMKRHVQRIGTE
jgi:hypothetical protein